MADTVNIDVFSYTRYPTRVPIIYKDHPVYDYACNEPTLLQLIQLPNYVIKEAGTDTVITGRNIEDYFPHGGGGGGEGGTKDYRELEHKPTINGVELNNNRTAAQLNLMGIPSASSSLKVGQILTVKTVSGGKIADLSAIDDPSATKEDTANKITSLKDYEVGKTPEKFPTADAVVNLINDLDMTQVDLSASESIASIKEENGKLTVTKQNIDIKSNAVSGMTSYKKPTTLDTKNILASDSLNTAIGKLERNLDDKLDDGNYAASSTKGGSATSAVALDSKNIGSETQGVYFDNTGKPVAMTHTLNEDVPVGAVFTDTTYSAETNSGINIDEDNKITNTGVRGFVDSLEADANGTLRVNVNGTETTVTPKGLAAGAFKTIDSTPTKDSENLITSGGVKTELDKVNTEIDKKNDKILVFETMEDYQAAYEAGKVPEGTFFVIETEENSEEESP